MVAQKTVRTRRVEGIRKLDLVKAVVYFDNSFAFEIVFTKPLPPHLRNGSELPSHISNKIISFIPLHPLAAIYQKITKGYISKKKIKISKRKKTECIFGFF